MPLYPPDYSQSLSTYRVILNSCATQGAAAANGTYWLAYQRSASTSGANSTTAAGLIGLYAADYPAVGSFNPTLKIRVQLDTNAVAPVSTFTFGLYPISSTAGPASNIAYTLGTVVTGSTTSGITASAGSTLYNDVSADFSFPADGQYVLGFVQSGGSTAASSLAGISAQLLIRYV